MQVYEARSGALLCLQSYMAGFWWQMIKPLPSFTSKAACIIHIMYIDFVDPKLPQYTNLTQPVPHSIFDHLKPFKLTIVNKYYSSNQMVL